MSSIAQRTTDTGALLRFMVRADGIVTTPLGAFGVIASAPVAEMMGLAQPLYIVLASAFLFVYGASMFYFGGLADIPRWYARLTTAADTAWALGSFALVLSGTLNDTGNIFMFISANIVLLVAALKYTGLRMRFR